MSETNHATDNKVMLVREFLNLPGHGSIAFVYADVEAEETWLTLTIGDCRKSIELAFEVGSPEFRTNSFHKINRLIAVLEEFRAAIATCAARRITYEEGRDERRKAKLDQQIVGPTALDMLTEEHLLETVDPTELLENPE